MRPGDKDSDDNKKGSVRRRASSIASSVSDAAAKAGSDLSKKAGQFAKGAEEQIAAARSAAEVAAKNASGAAKNAASEVAKNVKEAASSGSVQSVKEKAQSAASGVLRSASAAAGIAAEEAVKGANAATAAARTAAEAAKAAVKAAKEAADKHKHAQKSDPHLSSEPEVAHSTFNFDGTEAVEERLFKTLMESIVTDEVIERINKMIKNYNQYDREFFTDQNELFETYNLLDRVTETVLVELSPQEIDILKHLQENGLGFDVHDEDELSMKTFVINLVNKRHQDANATEFHANEANEHGVDNPQPTLQREDAIEFARRSIRDFNRSTVASMRATPSQRPPIPPRPNQKGPKS